MATSENDNNDDNDEIKQSIDLIDNYNTDIPSKSLSKKRIIFIRHSQSTWNHASEKSNVDRVTTVAKGLFESMYKQKDLKDGGRYIDAPLSDLGILQSMDLNRFLQIHFMQNILKKHDKDNINNECNPIQFENNFVYNNININNENNTDLIDDEYRNELIKKDIESLLGLNHDSCVLTSNLRRTIDTAIIGLSHRWNTYKLENIYILSCLQEFGKGPDCISRTSPKNIPKIAKYTQTHKRINLKSLENFYQTRLDSSNNFGPKKDDNISRFDRMLEFNRYIFKKHESNIIVIGHSLWFQRFAKIFLLQQNNSNKPSNKKNNESKDKYKKNKDHIAITSKLYNAGIVGFDLCRIIKGSTDYYGIDSRTMCLIYKGFQKMDK